MTTLGRILLIDDDPDFLEVYGQILEQRGFRVGRCSSRTEARSLLSDRWDAVLLDQKLSGPNGPDDGIDLLGEADFAGAKVFLVTGFASDDAIDRAFASGVHDYLEKGPRLKKLLGVKLEQVVASAREDRLRTLTADQRDVAIDEAWRASQTESDAHRKGRALEELLILIFRSIRGFESAAVRLRSKDEEFDLVVRNESPDPYWQKESQFMLVECKNWTGKVGPDEIDRLDKKLERRHQRARLGFIVAPGGFTAGVGLTLSAERTSGRLIVPVGREDLAALATAPDRNAKLKELHERAVVSAS